MSLAQALAGIAFQADVTDVIGGVEGALGDCSGYAWFDWSALRGRLAQRGLLDRVYFYEVRWSIRDLLACQERADGFLGPLYSTTHIQTGVDPSINSVVILTADDLDTRR